MESDGFPENRKNYLSRNRLRAVSEVAEEDSASYWMDEAEEMLKASEVPASLMDDDIREHLHEMMAPCKNVTFVAAHLAHHRFKFEEDFVVV